MTQTLDKNPKSEKLIKFQFLDRGNLLSFMYRLPCCMTGYLSMNHIIKELCLKLLVNTILVFISQPEAFFFHPFHLETYLQSLVLYNE